MQLARIAEWDQNINVEGFYANQSFWKYETVVNQLLPFNILFYYCHTWCMPADSAVLKVNGKLKQANENLALVVMVTESSLETCSYLVPLGGSVWLFKVIQLSSNHWPGPKHSLLSGIRRSKNFQKNAQMKICCKLTFGLLSSGIVYDVDWCIPVTCMMCRCPSLMVSV